MVAADASADRPILSAPPEANLIERPAHLRTRRPRRTDSTPPSIWKHSVS